MSIVDRVGGRRGVQVAVLTVALLVVLAFLAMDTLGRSRETVGVYVMTHSVSAGSALDSSSVRQEQIPAPGGAFVYLSSDPSGHFASHALSTGDILRADDVESSPVVAVPVKLGGYQPSAGEIIDIYVVEGGKVSLVGRAITVGNSGTILVPASDEPLWIALYGGSASLLAARSNGTGVPDSGGISSSEAARRLGAIARQDQGVASTPTP